MPLRTIIDQNIWIIQTTLPDSLIEPTVDSWISYFIEEKLTKCIQRSRITSVYEWENKTLNTEERKLQMKTTLSNKELLIQAIKDKHFYYIPQIITWQAETSNQYARWIEG